VIDLDVQIQSDRRFINSGTILIRTDIRLSSIQPVFVQFCNCPILLHPPIVFY